MKLKIFISILLTASFVLPATAQWNRELNRLGRTVENELKNKNKNKKPTQKQSKESIKEQPEAESPAPANDAPSRNEPQTAAASVQTNKRLVFSDRPIDPSAPTDLKTSFNAGDKIYGLLLLDVPFKDFIKTESIRHPQFGYSVDRPAFSIELKIDGNPLFSGLSYFPFDLDNKQTAWDSVPTDKHFFIDIAPDVKDAKMYAYPKMFFGLVSAIGRPDNKSRAGGQYYSYELGKLSGGEHTIEFHINGKESVTGSFKISGANFAAYKGISNALDAAGAANASIPPAKWKDAALETSIKTAVRNAGNRDQIMRVSITNPAWYIQKNALGQILYRGVFAVTAHKRADGKCYFVQNYFKQNYGGGRYGATVQDGRGSQVLIECANVMK